MRTLKSFLVESILSTFDKLSKEQDKAMKAEINSWLKTNFKKSSGRVKVVLDKGLGMYIAEYKNGTATANIDLTNIPEHLLFDIDCEILYITNANDSKGVLSHFKQVNASYLLSIKKSNSSIGASVEQSHIESLHISDEKSQLDLNGISNVTIDRVSTHTSCCKDLSPLVSTDVKKVHINANNGDTIKLGGLKGELLDIHRDGRGECNIKISGNYEFDEIRTYCCVVDGLPPKLNKLNDTWGYNVANAKHIQDCVSLPDVSADAAIEILEKLQSGVLKIDKITDYTSPYPEIPRDEFIHDLQQRAVYTYTEGNYRNGIKAWGSHPMELDDFKKWADSTSKYEVIPFYNPDDKRSKDNAVYMILQNGIPVGSYVERGFNWSSKSRHLHTDQKDLLMEIL